MNYAISDRIPMVEGLVVAGANGVIDTRTEVANSLHPLLNVRFAAAVLIFLWDSSTGGTAKAIASVNLNWRVNKGSAPAWIENNNPQNAGANMAWSSGFPTTSWRPGISVAISPVTWGAASAQMPFMTVDDLALRIVTDATTNSGTFWADAYVIRHIG